MSRIRQLVLLALAAACITALLAAPASASSSQFLRKPSPSWLTSSLKQKLQDAGATGVQVAADRPGPKLHGILVSRVSRTTAELKGDLPPFLGTNFKWSVAWTHNDIHYVIKFKDILVDRMQAALNGLGGPSCTGNTPGAGGCLYFNPFSSAIAANAYTGQANPGFVSSLANSPDLVKWMYTPLSLVRARPLMATCRATRL